MKLTDLYKRVRKKARGSQRATKFVRRLVIRNDQLLRVISFDRIRARLHTWDGKQVQVFNEAEFLSAAIRTVRGKTLKLVRDVDEIREAATELEPEDRAAIYAALETEGL